MATRSSRWAEWLEERLGWRAVQKAVEHKEVPRHRHTIWYYFGGMTLFLFSVQVATGILLLLYYRPSAEAAFESVQFIMTEVQFGWLIRSVHSWSANLMIATAFIHMFSAPFLLRFLRGGDEVTGATLTRFFGFHVAILPALTTVVLGLHLYLVQKHGMSVPPGMQEDKVARMKFYPNFLLRDLVGWLAAVTVLAALAALFPWELGEKADAFASAPAGIKPEWYFVFMFQTLKYIPSKVLGIDGELLGISFFGLLALLLIATPFLASGKGRRGRLDLLALAGGAALIYILALSALAYLT